VRLTGSTIAFNANEDISTRLETARSLALDSVMAAVMTQFKSRFSTATLVRSES
jgi:hypothetical protein